MLPANAALICTAPDMHQYERIIDYIFHAPGLNANVVHKRNGGKSQNGRFD